MTTLTLWLLIAAGYSGGSGNHAPGVAVVERFATLDECERVLRIARTLNRSGGLQCVQATVAAATTGSAK